MKPSKEKSVLPLSADQRKGLKQFEKIAGLRFKNIALLARAFSHSSLQSEYGEIANNEKLEFLGDSVLGLIITEFLYQTLPQASEGQLAKIKSFVVSENGLAAIASTLELHKFIFIGRSEEKSGGREKKAILADALEALIAAYYLDAGMRKTRNFVIKHFQPEIDKVLENKHQQDYKSLLQEHLQKNYRVYPKYEVVRKSGPDHNKTFWVQVKVNNKNFGPASGRSKKDAEKAVAEVAYKSIVKKKVRSGGLTP